MTWTKLPYVCDRCARCTATAARRARVCVFLIAPHISHGTPAAASVSQKNKEEEKDASRVTRENYASANSVAETKQEAATFPVAGNSDDIVSLSLSLISSVSFYRVFAMPPIAAEFIDTRSAT